MTTTATRFDAASDRATYSGGGGAPPTPSAGWAACWWAYIAVDQNTFATMLRLWAGGTVLNMAMGSTGTSPGAFTGGGVVEIDTQCTVGAWYFICYTVSGSTLTVYVFDSTGALFDSATGTIGGGTPTGLTVGGRDASDPDEWFNGRLSLMRIWSTTRTQAEFSAEQFAASPVITANLWEYWPLTGAGDLAGAFGGHDLAAGSTATTTEDGPPLSTGVSGSATVALGAVVVTVNGTRVVTGQAAVTLGAPTVTANGTRTAVGQTAVTLGTPVTAITGVRTVAGSTAVTLGAVSVTVVAARRVSGSASVALGAPSVTVTARRTVPASVVLAPGGAAVAAVGRRLVRGVASVALPAVMVSVVVADDHDVVVSARLASQGRVRGRMGSRRSRARLGAQR